MLTFFKSYSHIMKYLYFTILIFLMGSISIQAQKIVRQSINAFGNSRSTNGLLIRQTSGQESNTTTITGETIVLRQGFQQPLKNVPSKIYNKENT